MATKKEVIEQASRGEGCLGRAAEDEPIFPLRAQDRFFSELVERWAEMAEGRRCPPEKVAEAREVAAAGRAWQKQKWPD